MVNSNGSVSDGQSQANATSRRVPRVIHSKEGLTEFLQAFFRHTGSVVAHADFGGPFGGSQADFDRGIRRRLTNGIAHNVFEGAPQQLAIAYNIRIYGSFDHNAAVLRLGFDVAILGDILEKVCNAKRLVLAR